MDSLPGEGNRNFTPHNDFIESTKESHSFIDEDYQQTLDPYRSVSMFKNDIQNLNQRLQEKYDSGVESSVLYGSATYGTTIFPDSAMSQALPEHHPKNLQSDIDGIILLEADVPEEQIYNYIETAKEELEDITNEDFDNAPSRHYWVHPQDEFKNNKLGSAVDDWLKGKRAEFLAVPEEDRNPELENEKQKELPVFGRTVWSGYYLPEGFENSDLQDKFEKCVSIVEDNDGRLKSGEDFSYDFKVREHFEERFDKEPNKIDLLKENAELGRNLRILRRHSYDTDQYTEDGKVLTTDILLDAIDKALEDEELAEICSGDLTDMEVEVPENHRLSEWNDTEPEDSTLLEEEKIKRIIHSAPGISSDKDSEYKLENINLEDRLDTKGKGSDEIYLIKKLVKEKKIKSMYEELSKRTDVEQNVGQIHEAELSELLELEEELGTSSDGNHELSDF